MEIYELSIPNNPCKEFERTTRTHRLTLNKVGKQCINKMSSVKEQKPPEKKNTEILELKNN